MPRLKGFRYPREIASYAVWACHRFALSTADVEDLLAERGIIVTRETIRLTVNRFGSHFADCVRRDRPAAADKWHIDEVVIPIKEVVLPVPGVDLRVRLLHGRDDTTIAPQTIQRFADQHRVSINWIDGAGHTLPFSHWQDWIRMW